MGTDRNISELLEMGKKLIGYEETRAELLERYPLRSPEGLPESSHRYLVGRASRIARQCIDYGGTDEEVKAALTYMMLCIDAKKYRFDAKRYYVDNIATLDRKYQVASK